MISGSNQLALEMPSPAFTTVVGGAGLELRRRAAWPLAEAFQVERKDDDGPIRTMLGLLDQRKYQ